MLNKEIGDELVQEAVKATEARNAKIEALANKTFAGDKNTFSYSIKDIKPVQPWAKEQSKPVTMTIVALENKIDKLKAELLSYKGIEKRLQAFETKYKSLKKEHSGKVEVALEDNREEILGCCYAGLGFADAFTEKMPGYYFIGIESIKLNFTKILKCLR